MNEKGTNRREGFSLSIRVLRNRIEYLSRLGRGIEAGLYRPGLILLEQEMEKIDQEPNGWEN